MAGKNTRTRILVNSLILFNEQGEPNTTTNEIADEVDISPGNLHYHFRRKSDIVDALLAEFQADVRRALEPPEAEHAGLAEFWAFLHVLVEILAAYRFLFRDLDTLTATYPQVSRSLQGFVRALGGTIELYLHALNVTDELMIDDADVRDLTRSIVLVAMFSDRLDALSGRHYDAGRSAIGVARSTLRLLRPYAHPATRLLIDQLSSDYAG